jgi:beta-glucosidase-like glycosyl hydrolase
MFQKKVQMKVVSLELTDQSFNRQAKTKIAGTVAKRMNLLLEEEVQLHTIVESKKRIETYF